MDDKLAERRARERASFEALRDLTADDRDETDPCERGTVGCSVRHPFSGPETDCETW